jgi:5,10-methenyltetrahydromethanopterin hydrogenase
MEDGAEEGELIMSEETEIALTHLSIFIKKNTNLIHIDFSNTEMQDGMIKAIVDSISESKSLMVAHLDGNPGLSPSLIEYITEKLEAAPPL